MKHSVCCDRVVAGAADHWLVVSFLYHMVLFYSLFLFPVFFFYLDCLYHVMFSCPHLDSSSVAVQLFLRLAIFLCLC